MTPKTGLSPPDAHERAVFRLAVQMARNVRFGRRGCGRIVTSVMGVKPQVTLLEPTDGAC